MRHGPVYDNALRLLAATDLLAVCRWLGIDAVPGSVRHSEALPSATRHADLVASVGPRRLAHVEFVRTPAPDLGLRMLGSRALLMHREPGHGVQQHVVVLASGTVPAELRDGNDLLMRLHVTYLRDHEPDDFLADPSLAPLAVLGHAPDAAHRVAALSASFRVVSEVPDPVRRTELADVAAVLAAIHLDPLTIERAGKEAGMPITLEGTVGGRALVAQAEARGEARGQAAGRTEVLRALLDQRFGPDLRITEIAHRLGALPQDRALASTLSATRLEDLLPDGPAEG